MALSVAMQHNAMEPKYDLTVSIVTYCNDERELMDAVNSVLNSENVNFKLFIIDNSPTDKLRHLFVDSRIEYIFNNANVGFGAGHNIALRHALDESKYHLCLNPDTYFEKNVLFSLVQYMDKNTGIGQVLPKVIKPTGECQCRNRRLLPMPEITFLQFIRIFFKKSINHKLDRFFTRFISYDECTSAPFFGGCFIFLRIDAIRKIGLFDERFFMYYEDADISRRMYTEIGNMYYPLVKITHIAHTDSHKNLKMLLIHIKSAFKYYNKWGWIDTNGRKINNDFVRKHTK